MTKRYDYCVARGDRLSSFIERGNKCRYLGAEVSTDESSPPKI